MEEAREEKKNRWYVSEKVKLMDSYRYQLCDCSLNLMSYLIVVCEIWAILETDNAQTYILVKE